MKVVEIFSTLQGEGKYIGEPSVFLRLGKCNLSCSGCDTKWDAYDEVPAAEVFEAVFSRPEPHLVITGGEPTLWQTDIAELVRLMVGDHERGTKVITIETNGSVPIMNEHLINWIDLWSFSPKVGSLGADQVFKWVVVQRNLARLPRKKIQMKYVLDPYDKEGLKRIVEFNDYLTTSNARPYDDSVFFQPLDRDTRVNVIDRVSPLDALAYARDLAELSKVVGETFRHRFRVLPQLHKLMLAAGGLKEERESAESRR